MEFNINTNLSMNMQSIGSRVYNEALFKLPYKSQEQDHKDKLLVWAVGIVSYIKMDFHSKEMVDGYPKYIIDHGHLAALIEKEDIFGTMRDLGDHEAFLKRAGYGPEALVSVFEINNPNHVNQMRAMTDINRAYKDLFLSRNNNELSEKMIRAYHETVSNYNKESHSTDEELLIYYGNRNDAFIKEAAKYLSLEGTKISEKREGKEQINAQ